MQLQIGLTHLLSMRMFFILITLALSSCGKPADDDCFSQELMDQNANSLCTQDCPGICGCDGMTYCNSCIAAQNGISKFTDGPCE